MPAWVESCIKKYVGKGMSKKEASQRCYGAEAKRKKKKTRKKAR